MSRRLEVREFVEGGPVGRELTSIDGKFVREVSDIDGQFIRIGEISAQLETAERPRTDLHPTAGEQTKTQVLKAAGISTSAAHP